MDSFFRRVWDFLGPVCRYFKNLSGKSFKIEPSTYQSFVKEPASMRCKYDEHTLCWQDAQARKDPGSLPVLLCSRSQSFIFLAKVTMKEVWTEGRRQIKAASPGTDCTEKHVSAWQVEDLEKQKRRLQGEEITGSVCVLPFENDLFFFYFEANRSSK